MRQETQQPKDDAAIVSPYGDINCPDCEGTGYLLYEESAGRCDSCEPPALPVNEVQAAHLDAIRRISFNSFDCNRVVDYLIEHRKLWVAVAMDARVEDFLSALECGQEIIRDTMHIVARPGKELELSMVVHRLSADEVDAYDDFVAGRKAFRLWWD